MKRKRLTKYTVLLSSGTEKNQAMRCSPRFSILLAFLLCLGLATCVRDSSTPTLDGMVLEVVTNYDGLVIPKGDILEIRLFESGRFEYDDYPRCDGNQSYVGEVNVVRRESTVDKDAVRDLIGLAQQPDFQSAKETFPPPAQSGRIDTSSTTTIRFNYEGTKKTISASDFNDIEYIERCRSDYPDSMVKLYEKVLGLNSEIFARSKTGCQPAGYQLFDPEGRLVEEVSPRFRVHGTARGRV